MTEIRDVVILGSTGSIGTQAIDVIRRNPDRCRVVGLSAGGARPALLARQALDLGVEVVAVADPIGQVSLREAIVAEAARRGLATRQYRTPRVLAGPHACAHLAAEYGGAVLNGITGSVGLAPTLAALEAGRILILANKESLIVGGPLVKALAVPGQIVPVDSEHSALAQCLRGGRREEIRRLILTASGGPFRGRSPAELVGVTPEQALAHPTWAMGPVVSINSATLVNKGLELIEAHLLFDIPFDRIDVVVHPQSIVHGMVEYVDGSTIAQLSPPDMRVPLSLGLGWPDRIADAAPACDWNRPTTLEFHPLDEAAFPAVRLARAAGAAGGTMPAVYNAANEECVRAFLGHRLPFSGIVDTIARVLSENPADGAAVESIADVLEAEEWARRRARELIAA
jgi:1-deoxy-D-xylulose-5-phosphate reductoisomerase